MDAISYASILKTAERETKTNLTVESTLREIFQIRFYLTLFIIGIFKDKETAPLELTIEKDAQGINSAMMLDNLDSSRENHIMLGSRESRSLHSL